MSKVGHNGQPFGSPETVNNRGTLTVRLQDVLQLFPITITLVTSTSGNGGRAADNEHAYASDHVISGVDPPGPSLQYIDPIGISGNPNTQVGIFQPPGPNGSGGDSVECATIDPNTLLQGGATGAGVIEQQFILENPEVQNGVIPSAEGQFTLLNNKIEILDINTGVIATGPNDDFNFKVKILQ